MAGFDPDAYLAAKPSAAFDPDAYLSSKPSTQPAKPQTTLMQDIKQGVGDVVAGGIRGAGSIGATLL